MGGKKNIFPDFKSKIRFLPILLDMRKSRYLQVDVDSHVTAKMKYSFKLKSFVHRS